MNPYSNDKALWHLDSVKVLREGKQPIPKQVQLIISDLCNQNCSFCAYRMDGYTSNQHFGQVDEKTGKFTNNPVRFIPYQKAIEIIDDAADMGVKAIQFTGGGEPTVHAKHKEIFSHALDRGLQIALVTNGVLLKEQLREILIHATWVRVSIDAGLPETYAKIREVPESQFHRSLENIRELIKLKKKHQSPLTIGVGFVVTEDNWTEMRYLTQIAKDMGADNVRLSAVFQPEHFEYFKRFYSDALALSKECSAMAEGKFKVFNLFTDRVEDLIEEHPDYSFCGYQHFNTYIGGDLNVYRCCVTSYNDIGILGSLKEKRLKDFWLSQEKENKMSNFDARGCPQCQFNQRNRNINSVIDPDPPHINFV